MLFREIIGQDHIKNHMQKSLREGKISHAYIINGEKESGKMMLAKTFSQALFCEKGGDEPCGECPSCLKVAHNNHPDLIYVTHEKPNNIAVREIRDQVVGDMMIRPYSASRKIYIIEDAQLMNASAQNAILKSLEEPPEYVTILLLTDNASALLQTIRSRCILLNIEPVIKEQEIIKRKLIQEYEMPEYEAEDILNFAQGNVGKAFSLASSESFRGVMEDTLGLVKQVSSFRQVDVENKAEEIKAKWKNGEIDLKEYLDLLVLWYRDVLLYKATANEEYVYFKDHIREIRKQAERGSFKKLSAIINKIETSRNQLRSNVDAELVFILLMQVMKEI
ncbi:MAG: DNA polymerase III subunit delta [Lachnospiraceae bacterium]|nr:DNA polymerase III subunit delta [Lachnospiraceae bacterium]